MSEDFDWKGWLIGIVITVLICAVAFTEVMTEDFDWDELWINLITHVMTILVIAITLLVIGLVIMVWKGVLR